MGKWHQGYRGRCVLLGLQQVLQEGGGQLAPEKAELQTPANFKTLKMRVELDGAGILAWRGKESADWVYVDRVGGTAVITTPVLAGPNMGSKLCQGQSLTGDEFEALKKSAGKTTGG
ncbi:MAG TPA: hypothetical protein VK698_28395 [Kofleriaceae bacterium]|nr:hypothetical protein [Kofleriaceae bacterium]